MASRTVHPEPLSHSYGSPDVFGRYHNPNGDTIFHFYERLEEDSELTAYDTFSITELNEAYTAPNSDPTPPPYLEPGQTIPKQMIVTSPNMSWMPFISLLPRPVRARADGRFAWANFTVCPQWFIESQWHLPFVRARPPKATIKNHELSFCWWELHDNHFVEAKGYAFHDLRTLREDIADSLRNEARKLQLACRQIKQLRDHGRLFYLSNKTVNAALQLKFCSFSKRDLVYCIAGFQRVYLETLAMFDWHTKWAFRLNEPSGKIYEVDESIMGAITDNPECIAVLYRVGAPGWYVRPPANLSPKMIIRQIIAPGWEKMPVVRGRSMNDVDPCEFTYQEYPGTPYPTIITACPRSDESVAACQNWREGHFGIIDPQPVVTQAVSGMAVVEAFPGSRQPNAAPNGSSGINANNASQTSINLTKFHEPEHAFVPPQSRAWKNALAAVNTDPRRISSSLSARNLCGYQFPDPFLFISGNNSRSMLLAWLMMRDQWLQSLVGANSSPQLPLPQHWRNFLHDFAKIMQLLPSVPPTSNASFGGVQKNKGKKAAPSNQCRTQKAKDIQGSIFSTAVSIGDRPGTVYWGDVVVMQGETDRLSPLIMAQVIWNAFEQNFCYEVRHLDHHLLPSAWASDTSAGVHENLVRSVFPEDSDGVLVAGVPLFTRGLAAEKWQDRMQYVEALQHLMTAWPGDGARRLKACYLSHSSTQAVLEETEQMVASLYCQTFFDCFGRAPCTLHQIPGFTLQSPSG